MKASKAMKARTSEDLAKVLGAAEFRWMRTALRKRLDDGDRQRWKARFMARAVLLLAFWARPVQLHPWAKTYREKHKLAGLCVACPEPAVKDRSRCVTHLAEQRELDAADYDKRRVTTRRNVCTVCNVAGHNRRRHEGEGASP